ncbi:MAG TPA: metallophosphoesterase family protein [Polyangiaceae bacterium LLY-WYZ-15_(1-7)]|nr:hypothetical protein [Sandaracinus sp.]HJK99841.1 metallophosphoesterase family protein [Polyangiaceae bacterium LLY-WYZ-15_(1-7)]HJL11367.1 metallophosphoesterase family protein [Polyangiaceae bacterium LLY-WYZ-15_(1-7)]HJL27067.1 metallophosphoesterase family protein [Polyangiaceae bacterium LLY-WYZ-15_(1-7)]HJL44368.1 metallophosphoesterase family protein [Polyangiaceae bacterium LLY-WYZ-15_(1-7)]
MSRSALARPIAALALGLLLAAPATAQRAPYLQRLTPTEVTVVWRTADAARGTVCWGPAPDALSERVDGVDGLTQHELRLAGLSPNTRYWYAAVTDGACPARADEADTFRTGPPVGSREPFRLWVVGDSGTGGSRQREVRDAMLAHAGDRRPDLFLHVGDMAYSSGTTGEFTDRFFAVYADILRNTPCWPAMGNHEGYTSDSDSESGPYYDAYVLPRDGRAGGVPSGTEAWYSFDHGNVHFVVLDSYDSPRSPGGSMLSWLEEDLAATDQEWIVAYFHHPPYTKGSHDSDTERAHIDMRENALPILEAWGVDVVLGGHSHIYERSYLVSGAYDTPTRAAGHIVDPGDGRLDGDGAYDMVGPGALYVVAGHGGAGVSGDGDHPLMYFSEVENGSVLVDVNGGSMTLVNVRRDGAETDRVTLVRGEGLYLLAPTGGERLLAGSELAVRWTGVGEGSGQVDLALSLDGGASWTPIVEGTEDDGEHRFTLPRVLTEDARVRLSDSVEVDREDVSAPFALTDTTEITLAPFGGTWEYHDAPEAPPAEWSTTLGGWPSGPAQLGYGDGDEATVLRDEDPNVPTVYFRRGVELPGEVVSAQLDVLYDDGIAVFVGGEQVFGVNVDDGLAHEVFASDASGDDERASATIDGAAFTVGENVIAALVKQRSGGSSDVSFDLRLRVTVRVDIPDPPPDAGAPDRDAGAVDGDGGAAPEDAGAEAEDAGADGGAGDEGAEGDGEGGCGCRTARRSDAGGLLGLALVLWVTRRRRG